MRYKCKFPGCEYETNSKHQIHSHHIIPKCLGGSNKKFNKILLCPNCHHKIFQPLSPSGIHSKKTHDSIELIEYKNNGMFLEYKEHGEIKYNEI